MKINENLKQGEPFYFPLLTRLEPIKQIAETKVYRIRIIIINCHHHCYHHRHNHHHRHHCQVSTNLGAIKQIAETKLNIHGTLEIAKLRRTFNLLLNKIVNMMIIDHISHYDFSIPKSSSS